MYDPKSYKDSSKKIKPAPLADAAVNDSGLTTPGSGDPDFIEEVEIEDIDYPEDAAEPDEEKDDDE